MSLADAGSVLLVGAGRMGSAMLEGWLERGLPPRSVTVLEPSPSDEIAALCASRSIPLNPTDAGATPVGVVVLAVKPQVMDEVLPIAAAAVGPGTVVLSIAAGRTIAGLAAPLPPATAVVRSIPNTPAAIGRGMTVAVGNAALTPAQREICTALLAALGAVEWIADETLMDAVTAVSGSGPAYVFLLAESLAEAGIAAGLPPALAERIARATVAGAGELLARSPLDPAMLRRNVTSPGGTTAAALAVLQAEDGMGPLMREAVAAATRRSRELAG